MKLNSFLQFSTVALLAGAATFAFAQSDPQAKSADKAERKARAERPAEKEKVTYLGIETGPVPRALAAHLGLDRDMGLVVNAVAEESPAAGVLKQHDIITKFGDQLLVDSRQLTVLVRARQPGDEVKLTVIRGGKETTVTAKLGERELPRVFGFRAFDSGNGDFFRIFDDNGAALESLREIPGMAREELNDVLRILERERGNWFASPRVHVFNRKLQDGSTILNLNEGNFSFSDEDGSLEVNASNGERQLTVKDASGKVLFQGPINTDEERNNLPKEVKDRLKKLESVTIDFEADESLEREGAVAPAPRTRTSAPALRVLIPAPSRPF